MFEYPSSRVRVRVIGVQGNIIGPCLNIPPLAAVCYVVGDYVLRPQDCAFLTLEL